MNTVEINAQIATIYEMFEDFISYNDTVSFIDSDQKKYVTSDTLLLNVEKSTNSAIQALQELKKTSLNEYTYTTVQETTLLNLCFQLYGKVTEENIEKLINANDFHAYNRIDIDPMEPVIKRDTVITYYK
jgi:hypothetical protein